MGEDVTFRAGVGALIIDAHGRILAFERRTIPGAWQAPQGGIEPGEQLRDALFREVEEETSITASMLTILEEHPGWLGYEFPPERSKKQHRGQTHRWFLLRFEGKDEDIDPASVTSQEFTQWRWTTIHELLDQVVDFKRAVYEQLATHFANHLK